MVEVRLEPMDSDFRNTGKLGFFLNLFTNFKITDRTIICKEVVKISKNLPLDEHVPKVNGIGTIGLVCMVMGMSFLILPWYLTLTSVFPCLLFLS